MEVTFADEIEQIRVLAGRVAGLPALPMIVTQLLEAVDDPHTSASELASLISSDTALATRLLKLANSAYYGFPRRIGTVNLAVVVLGFETVRDLCLSVLITDCFFQGADKMPIDMEEFWRHSLSVAICTRIVYRTSGAKHPGEGFIAGLVHDIGRLFLARYFPEDYTRVLNTVEKDGLNLMDAERKVFSTTHSVAGAWLIDEWNLPVWLVESTKNHHCFIENTERKQLSQSVCLADKLVKIYYSQDSVKSPGIELTPEVKKSLRIRTEENGFFDYNFYFKKFEIELNHSEKFMETIRKPVSAGYTKNTKTVA